MTTKCEHCGKQTKTYPNGVWYDTDMEIQEYESVYRITDKFGLPIDIDKESFHAFLKFAKDAERFA